MSLSFNPLSNAEKINLGRFQPLNGLNHKALERKVREVIDELIKGKEDGDLSQAQLNERFMKQLMNAAIVEEKLQETSNDIPLTMTSLFDKIFPFVSALKSNVRQKGKTFQAIALTNDICMMVIQDRIAVMAERSMQLAQMLLDLNALLESKINELTIGENPQNALLGFQYTLVNICSFRMAKTISTPFHQIYCYISPDSRPDDPSSIAAIKVFQQYAQDMASQVNAFESTINNNFVHSMKITQDYLQLLNLWREEIVKPFQEAIEGLIYFNKLFGLFNRRYDQYIKKDKLTLKINSDDSLDPKTYKGLKTAIARYQQRFSHLDSLERLSSTNTIKVIQYVRLLLQEDSDAPKVLDIENGNLSLQQHFLVVLIQCLQQTLKPDHIESQDTLYDFIQLVIREQRFFAVVGYLNQLYRSYQDEDKLNQFARVNVEMVLTVIDAPTVSPPPSFEEVNARDKQRQKEIEQIERAARREASTQSQQLTFVKELEQKNREQKVLERSHFKAVLLQKFNTLNSSKQSLLMKVVDQEEKMTNFEYESLITVLTDLGLGTKETDLGYKVIVGSHIFSAHRPHGEMGQIIDAGFVATLRASLIDYGFTLDVLSPKLKVFSRNS